MDIFEVAGYKFIWKKKKVIKNGLSCLVCGKVLKKGDYVYIKYNRWTNRISDFRCIECHKKRNKAVKKVIGGMR